MANVSQSVLVCSELQVALNVLSGLVADVKAGKSAGAVVSDALPGVIGALSSLSALEADVSAANSVAVDNTFALWVAQFKQVLFPGVV